MAEINARIPLAFDTSTIYNPVKAQANQLALQKGRNDIQNQEFEQQLQPYKLEAADNASQLDQIKVHGAKVERALSLLQMARHPASYNAALEQAKAEGLVQPGEFPDQWNPQVPNMVFNARKSLMPLKDQLDNTYRQAVLAIQQENLKMSREDRNADRALRDRYYNIMENNARTKSTGEYVDPDTGEIVSNPEVNKKPLPVGALKEQNALLEDIGLVSSMEADLGTFRKQLDTGELDLGLFSNLASKARNKIGSSTPESRNFGSFTTTLEKLRNDSLRLNKGVQTEGDAVRAWNELFASINDPELVKQRLDEIMVINERAAETKKNLANEINRNYGRPERNFEEYSNKKAAIGSTPNKKQNMGGWSIEPVE